MPIIAAPSEPVAVNFEAEIAALLDDLSSVQSDLLEVLEQRREALATANRERLAELQPREEQLLERLSECQRRRLEILATARAQGLPTDNVAKLATKVSGGKRGALGQKVKEVGSRMRLLQHQSFANWVLAQRSLLHVSQLLEIVATGGRMQPTYGDKESVHTRGALLNQQA